MNSEAKRIADITVVTTEQIQKIVKGDDKAQITR